MKKNKIVTCGCALIALSLFLTGCGKEIELKNGAKVAVSTEEEKITATEYYNMIKENNIASLVDMIDTNILEKKYETTEDENKYVEDQITQIKKYYGSDEQTYQNVLKTYFGVQNEKELETKLRLEYKRTQAVSDYIKENLDEKEINEYYETSISGKIKASHILIASDAPTDATEEEKEYADEKALKKAQEIIKKLKKGEDFAKLAKKNSEDKGSAEKGGDLDYFDPNTMVPEFAEAVKALEIDEYTKEPVKSQYGYHIILKTGEKDKPSLEEAEEEIKEALKEKKLSENSSLYYETLIKVREKSNIKWNDTVLKSAYNKYMDQLIESVSES